MVTGYRLFDASRATMGDEEAADPTIRRDLRSVVTRLVGLGMGYRRAAEEWQMEWLLAELRLAQGNQCAAARHMCVHRNTVSRLLLETGLVANKKRRGRRAEKVFLAGVASGQRRPPVWKRPVDKATTLSTETM